MEAGQDDDPIVDDTVDGLIRKAAHQKPRAEAVSLFLVPVESRADIRFSLRPVDQSLHEEWLRRR